MRRVYNSISITILIGLIAIAGSGNCRGNSRSETIDKNKDTLSLSQGGERNLQNLIQSVLNKDPSAAILAQEIGPRANPELIKLAQNNDPEVRFIALGCLDETGGEGAAQTFAKALLDIDGSVRNAAIQGLMNHPDADIYNDLLNAYDKSDDETVRKMIPMIAANLDEAINIEDLILRYQKENNPVVKEGLLVALAKQGDVAAQKEFSERLVSSSGQKRREYLEYCEYIGAPWFLKSLIPLLSDKEEMIFIGLDSQPQLPQYLRACDVVVELVASITGKKFSFPVGGPVNYTDQQLNEVREYLRQQ
jgi:hypothetical protein